jgi:D-lactate dehydrogenase (cytochrome)
MNIFPDLQDIVGPDHVSAAAADRQQHAHDQSDQPPSLPDIVVWPGSAEEVSAILKLANRQRIPVTAWGAGTSLEGQPLAIFGGIILDFGRMNRIVKIHDSDFQVTVQPGIFYMDMNKQLARHGLFFAPDPGANASIGGMLANNAAGIRTVKYGATRDNVLALEVVLANGDVIRTGSRSVKQSAGYDLTHLFVGSEGTLGLITEATLQLAPLPEHFSAATVAFPDVAAAAQTVFDIIASGLEPTALELLDETSVEIINTEPGIDLDAAPTLFLEFNGASEVSLGETLELAETICRENGCLIYQAGIGRDARARLWEARHRLFEVMVRYHQGLGHVVTDVAVPISMYPEVVQETAAIIQEFQITGHLIGHAGDGNLHTALFFPSDDETAVHRVEQARSAMVKLALSLNGTCTGEHGVGLGKQKYMLAEHGPKAIHLMRQLKTTLDPHNILNPGKVLPELG